LFKLAIHEYVKLLMIGWNPDVAVDFGLELAYQALWVDVQR